jgi:hypothetical protein
VDADKIRSTLAADAMLLQYYRSVPFLDSSEKNHVGLYQSADSLPFYSNESDKCSAFRLDPNPRQQETAGDGVKNRGPVKSQARISFDEATR